MTAELEALERWARGRRLWLGDYPADDRAWDVSVREGLARISVRGPRGALLREGIVLDPLTALLWASAVDLRYSWLALLVCEAAPRRWSGVQAITGNAEVDRMTANAIAKGIMVPGDPSAREALTIASDKLLAAGDPLGEWVAAWLRGECPTCEGRGGRELGAMLRHIGANGDVRCTGQHWDLCEQCQGHGVILGAHVDAMVAGLSEGLDASEPARPKGVRAEIGEALAPSFETLVSQVSSLSAGYVHRLPPPDLDTGPSPAAPPIGRALGRRLGRRKR